jgi:transcriptional regulator with XRE-family HTH domain
MATTDTLARPATLSGVPDEDETTAQRIKRLREELGWTQVELQKAAGLKSVETVGNVERDVPAARGERPSVQPMLAAMERERQRRQGENGPQEDRQLAEFLARPDIADMRLRRIGPRHKARFIAVIIPDPDATDDEIQATLEEFHRQQRRSDPND